MDQDTEGGGAMTLVPIRWQDAQIERADAAARATGLPRSVIMRAAFDQGIGLVERSITALQGVEVGAVSGTGDPA